MSLEPTEEAVENFVSFTSSTRKEAIDFLKNYNLDNNRAINAYFEKPATPQVESLLGQEGGFPEQSGYDYQNQDVPSFNIENSDSPSNNNYRAPPSRPPSRMSNRGNTDLSTTVATDHTSANSGQGLSLAEREEEDMRQALAMSLNQELDGQETGVTNMDNTHFGRANKDHYEENAWAMTLFNSTAEEMTISPDPSDRQRFHDEPAFLRPSEESKYLGGLMTILHAIPLAREALLLKDKVLPTYGHDKQWWNGQPIKPPKIVSLNDDGYTEDAAGEDVLYETQRLIAFLDLTERAFGSSDSLATINVDAGFSSGRNRGAVEFLENWQISAVRATPQNQLATIFSSIALKRPIMEMEPVEREFVTLEADVMYRHGQTLYDAIDAMVWPDVHDQGLDDVWIDRLGEVFSMRLDLVSSTEKSVDVKVPAVWYPDRYMDSCKAIATDFRTRKLETLKEISRLGTLKDRYTTGWKGPRKGVNVKEALETAAECAEIATRGRLDLPHPDGPNFPEVTHEDGKKLAAELRAISKRIEEKVKSLEKRREEAQETLRNFSKVLTEPTSPTEPPYIPYTLRGVCTLPHVTYVLKRRASRDGDNDKGLGDGSDWQWWRLSFSTDDAKARLAETTQTAAVPSSQNALVSEQPKAKKKKNPSNVAGYTARKVREVEVLKAARDESTSALLVYANEKAVNFSGGSLPLELQEFMDADNTTFREEIQVYEQAPSNDEASQPSDSSTWRELEPLTGPSLSTVYNGVAPNAHVDPGSSGPSSKNPVSNPASNVNVYDYEVSSFTDDQESSNGGGTNGGGQEMQERRGSTFLSRGSQSSLVQNPHSMSQIPEEMDEDESPEVNHVEKAS